MGKRRNRAIPYQTAVEIVLHCLDGADRTALAYRHQVSEAYISLLASGRRQSAAHAEALALYNRYLERTPDEEAPGDPPPDPGRGRRGM
jgi:hypothetical protein